MDSHNFTSSDGAHGSFAVYLCAHNRILKIQDDVDDPAVDSASITGQSGARSEGAGVSARRERRNNKHVLGELWLAAVIVAVLVVVDYGVHTIRGNNEGISHPATTSTIPATVVEINPKNITYEAFGSLGGGGKVVYANLDSQPIEVRLASLPWSHSETTMSPSATLSLVMQVDGDSAGCRILVDGQVRDEHVVNHESAGVACTVTAA
jgi:hypothetical protein